ncbi:MAG: ABC transporter permease [Pseudorhodoplanes sp.]|uniref:ABC transporter permease n=1 Tax=Pseudorhodoplanes sp. TaxID=1934341 RepID=UPI003D0EBEEB
MSLVATPPRTRGWSLPLRFAARELRGGLRGFYVLIFCIGLGVMAIAGVGSFSESLAGGLAREGRTILGGDVSFALFHREASTGERALLTRYGRVSDAATLRAMARASGERSALVEVKAVDGLYPLYGTVLLEPAMPLSDALAARDGIFGAAVDIALLTRLELKLGDRVTVGDAPVEIRAVLRSEPDKLAGGIGFGPRMILSVDALRATGLLQPGSLVRWHYRVALPDNDASDSAVKALIAQADRQFPEAGWETRSRDNASPQLERNIERFTQFLTLVGLTALLVGGVGVANAVRSHLERRRDTIATMKSLGATGGRIFAIYLVQVMTIAAIGTALGLAAGAALPFLIAWAFGAVLPLPVEPALQWSQLGLAAMFGLLTALAFAMWPLGRAHDIPVSALFREAVSGAFSLPRKPYLLAAAAVTLALAALSILLAYDRRIATVFVAASAATFLLLYVIAILIMRFAAMLPRSKITALRLAIANIHRPGALTPSVVLSLGLGLAVLVIVVQIDGNLRRQFEQALPDRAPAFFFVDIQNNDAARFDAFIRKTVPAASVDREPMLRGRIVAANGVRADALKPTPQAAWALQSDRGITYSNDVPPGSRLVAGEWWPADYQGPPLLSMEQRIADGLGLKVGDTLTVNVLGRNITARIANLRVVDWQSLGINFVLVFSPNAFRGAPHTHIATLTFTGDTTAQQDAAILRDMAAAFPAVTAVRVKDAVQAVGSVVGNLILGIRGASLVTLIAAALVLAGALAASHHNRVYDAIILKTLGATRGRLISAYALEYALLGLATAMFGVLAGSVAAWLVVTRIMNLSYVWLPIPALAAAAAALAVTIVFGLAGTFTALGQKPASVLRNL